MTNGHGGTLCDAPLMGLMMTWDDHELVTCPACLKALRERRMEARKTKEDAENVELT